MLKQFRHHNRLCLVAVIPAILTSCVDVSPQELSGLRGNAVSAIGRSGGSRADKERFLEDNRKTVREGTGLGAIAGAVAGGVAGYYLGGESASAAIGGAMVGGALGGIGGAAAGRSKA
ncbi:MAG TPA: hypothetical protein PK648_17455, partial [Verrucomicrobiales bacterium]|nr:hypothetical protein [Verrucomicrobiales bacterium]